MWDWSRTEKLLYETLLAGDSSSQNTFQQIPEPPTTSNLHQPSTTRQLASGHGSYHQEVKYEVELWVPLPGRGKGRKFLTWESHRANVKLMSQVGSLNHFSYWNIVAHGSIVILEQDNNNMLTVHIQLFYHFQSSLFHSFIWLIFADHLSKGWVLF